MPTDFFTCSDGTRLCYETAGEGSPVALLHGFTLDGRMWDDQFDRFARSHRVLRHDFRGFGRSDPPQPGRPYTHARDLHELLEHLGIEQIALVGLSYGGWAALDFTLRYPGSVSALVLVDSGMLDYPYTPPWRGFLDSLSPLAQTQGVAAARAEWCAHDLFAFSSRVPGVSERIQAIVADYSGWHWLNDDSREIAKPAHTRLAEIDVPTLVVVGEHDLEDFQTIATKLGDGIPGATKVTLQNAGHMANMDAPDAFNELVLEFLAGVG
jgi:pimeloyl-ACP methyl ester carboxylesterase